MSGAPFSLKKLDWKLLARPAGWPDDGPPDIRIIPLGRSETVEEAALPHSIGPVFSFWKALKPAERLAQLFIDFHTLVVRDGIDPHAAHREFLKIKEYREVVAPELRPDE